MHLRFTTYVVITMKSLQKNVAFSIFSVQKALFPDATAFSVFLRHMIFIICSTFSSLSHLHFLSPVLSLSSPLLSFSSPLLFSSPWSSVVSVVVISSLSCVVVVFFFLFCVTASAAPALLQLLLSSLLVLLLLLVCSRWT